MFVAFFEPVGRVDGEYGGLPERGYTPFGAVRPAPDVATNRVTRRAHPGGYPQAVEQFASPQGTVNIVNEYPFKLLLPQPSARVTVREPLHNRCSQVVEIVHGPQAYAADRRVIE